MKKFICTFFKLTAFSIAAFSASSAIASPLTYQPTNPSFGGTSFNSSHLISLATDQKGTSASRYTYTPPDPLQEFSTSVQRSLLSRLSQDIADSILGEDANDSGQYLVGTTQLDFQRINGQVVINISDSSTGGSTTIEVPIAVQ